MNSRKLEREMRLGVNTSRRGMMERAKAMEGARNPGVSKFGDCLVSINSKSDKMLSSNIKKINSEIRRMELQMNQKIKHFVKTSGVLNYDPIILVNRPPSPEVVKRAATMTHYGAGNDYPEPEDEAQKPGYMKQIRSKARTPSTLTTIDAFVVKSRKKKNVWDGVLEDKEPKEFLSTVRPYAKLTNREKTDLQKGYEFHKPKLDNENHIAETDDSRKIKKSGTKKGKAKTTDNADDSDSDEMTPFITQMASVRKKKDGIRKEKTLAEIKVVSPILAITEANNPTNQDRSVRFNSPVALSEPGSKQKKMKLRTQSTKVSKFG